MYKYLSLSLSLYIYIYIYIYETCAWTPNNVFFVNDCCGIITWRTSRAERLSQNGCYDMLCYVMLLLSSRYLLSRSRSITWQVFRAERLSSNGCYDVLCYAMLCHAMPCHAIYGLTLLHCGLILLYHLYIYVYMYCFVCFVWKSSQQQCEHTSFCLKDEPQVREHQRQVELVWTKIWVHRKADIIFEKNWEN